MDKFEKLSKIVKDLILREPFYGMFLISLSKTFTDEIPAAAVTLRGINYTLLINDDFWNTINDKVKVGVLKHELLHIAFYHLSDYDHLMDKKVANIAEDLEINQYIKDEFKESSWLTLDMFSDLNLKPNAGTNYYYKELMKASPKSKSGKLIKQIKDALSGNSITFIDEDGTEYKFTDHSSWEDMLKDKSEAERKMFKKQMQSILKDIAESIHKKQGTIPSEFESYLNTPLFEQPKFDWKRYLRMFTGASNLIYTKKLRRKYNKRFEENPGLKIKKKNHVLVAIDTSGSVSDTELLEFMNEIKHIHRTGCEVTIAQCDAAISSIEKYSSYEGIKISGRGGTSFSPVIEYYNSNLKKYTSLVYLTDGEAPAPVKANGKMLWVMSSQSRINPSLIGPQVKLN